MVTGGEPVIHKNTKYHDHLCGSGPAFKDKRADSDQNQKLVANPQQYDDPSGGVETHNGALEAHNVNGALEAHNVNGALEAHNGALEGLKAKPLAA